MEDKSEVWCLAAAAAGRCGSLLTSYLLVYLASPQTIQCTKT